MLKESELMQMVHNPSSLQNPKSIHYRWMSKVGTKQLLRLLLADTFYADCLASVHRRRIEKRDPGRAGGG